MKNRTVGFPGWFDIQDKLNLQKPDGLNGHPPHKIEQYSVERLKQKYPKKVRRIYAPTLDVLKYWESKFMLDWGEPECFACKHLTYAPKPAKRLELRAKKYREKGKAIPNELFQEAWRGFEHCHIISACFGGPGEAWNIVYLCSSCHKEMDRLFAGYPREYYTIINWLQKRRVKIAQYMMQQFQTYVEEKGINLTSENIKEVIDLSLINSKDARSPQKNRHADETRKSIHGYSIANSVLARIYYSVDEYLKSNKPGPESV